MPISDVKLMDCMEGMKAFPDKFFDLAIVDPPYGLGDRLEKGGGKLKNSPFAKLYRESSKWDNAKPEAEYFTELFRVSKNQIIWGGNYFDLPPTRCIICWDKGQYMHTLSQWEMGWTSFDKVAKIFRKQSTDLNRFHPTQKPITLYAWLLDNYAKPGDKILDTHLGSMSSRIAAYKMGFDFWGFEIDPDYFADGENRFKKSIAMPLFDGAQEIEQRLLFQP